MKYYWHKNVYRHGIMALIIATYTLVTYISFKVRLMHDLSHINYTLTRIKGSLRKARTSELTGKHELQQSHMIPTHHSELITTQKSPNYKLQNTKLQGAVTRTEVHQYKK